MKDKRHDAYHLIFRRCEVADYEARKKDYQTHGVEFESSWYEEADKDDPYPHVHSLVYLEISKKTLQARLNKHLPQYNNLHVLKELSTPEYLENAIKYVCKDWNPLITDDDILNKYLPLKGIYNFEKNMKMQQAAENLAKLKTPSHKESFNTTICKDFELFFNTKQQKVTDPEIVRWLLDEYRCFQKDLDSIIIKRKFWMLKNMFRIKDKYSLEKLILKDLERDFQCY